MLGIVHRGGPDGRIDPKPLGESTPSSRILFKEKSSEEKQKRQGGPHNVRALCVTPGPVLTRAAMSGMPTALGRAGETHELVDVILFMCSENASFVTGTNHVVDGGRLCMYRPYVAPSA